MYLLILLNSGVKFENVQSAFCKQIRFCHCCLLYSRKPTPLTENQSSRYQLMVLRCVRGVRGAQQRQKRACLQKADRPFSNVTSDLTDLTNEHAYVRID